MKLPKGSMTVQVVAVDETPRQCSNFQECWSWFRPGDEYVEIHPGVWLCSCCWPEEVNQKREARRPKVCTKCNTLHPEGSECW